MSSPSVLRGPNGEYKLLAEQGRGAFGITYRARRAADGMTVIVKLLRLDRLGGDWKAFDLFEREAAVLRVLRHPGIPEWLDHFPVGDAGSPPGFALVQSFVEGATLAEIMRTPGARSQTEMLAWFDDLLAILEYLHGRVPAVIHRDITPKNVILRPQGGAALVDFGTVQAALQQEGVLAMTAAGTFGYAAPEQFMSRAAPSSDLYGAAMTYLAVASGREPTHMPLEGVRVKVRELVDGDRQLVQLLALMTHPDPRERLGTAREARQRIAQIRAAGRGPALQLAGGARSSVTFVEDFRARLSRNGFRIHDGGRVGETPLVVRARRSARPLERLPSLEVRVALAEDLPGHGGDGPIAPSALAAFAREGAVGERGWFLRLVDLLSGLPATVVAVVVNPGGIHPPDAIRVEGALHSKGPPVLTAAVVIPANQQVVWMMPAFGWSSGVRDTVTEYLVRLISPMPLPEVRMPPD
jgi:serine/threonine protein kinase